MDKIKRWWTAHRPTKRRLIQVYAALLYNAHIKGFVTGEIYTGRIKNLCVPGFNCYSCPGAIGACPLGALQNALASSGARAPYYVLGILLLFGLTLGRTICGFLCPIGLLQELLYKIPTPKLRKSRFTRALSWLKYVILAVFVLAIPLYMGSRGLPVPAFCKYICPAGTLEGAVGLLAHPKHADMRSSLGLLFARKFVILVIVIAVSVFVYRQFCRFLCPLGAIYGLFAKISLLGVKVDPVRCIDCGKCVRRCRMDIRHVGDHECIHCGDCISVCPTDAISWKGKKPVLRGSDAAAPMHASEKKRGKIRHAAIYAVAALLLICVMVCVNRPEQEAERPELLSAAQQDDGTIVGSEVGMRAPAFAVPLYAPHEGAFALGEHSGKIVVVNFWATWCPPCVQELPHFEQLQKAYPQDVEVIAIHHQMATEDVQAYLDKKAYSVLRFGYDPDMSVIECFGGSTMLPITVVIGRDGKIVSNQVGSVTYEMLEEMIGPCL